jgi:hypothetical protein
MLMWFVASCEGCWEGDGGVVRRTFWVVLLWREAERYESSWGKYKDLVGGVTGLHVRSELGLRD